MDVSCAGFCLVVDSCFPAGEPLGWLYLPQENWQRQYQCQLHGWDGVYDSPFLLSFPPFPLSPFPLLHSLPFYSIFLLPPFSSSPSPLPFLVGSSWWKLIDVTNQTSESFLECFRNNLLDIKVDPRPYGTHLFRRGGCQYFHLTRRWSFQQICNWGGWAEKFDNPGTIFKYLLSWNDNPNAEREHYMNPGRPGTDPCPACGRTCHCA